MMQVGLSPMLGTGRAVFSKPATGIEPRSTVSVPMRFAASPKAVEWTTTLSPETVLKRLDATIDKDQLRFAHTQSSGRLFRVRRGSHKFVGELEGNQFKMMNWIGYNNPWTPVLQGTVEKTPTGSKIQAQFTVLPAVEKYTRMLWVLGTGCQKLSRLIGGQREENRLRQLMQDITTP